MDAQAGRAFADRWIAAWRQRDLESLLSLYASDIEFRSPLAARVTGDPTGIVRGQENLRAYFARALAAFPADLNIELLDVYAGVNSIVVLFQAAGRRGAELMEFDGHVVGRAVGHALAV